MTENLLEKLEEKMMALFSQLEDAHKEIVRLSSENTILNTEKEKHTKKLEDLLAFLDATHRADNTASASMQTMKPALIQV